MLEFEHQGENFYGKKADAESGKKEIFAKCAGGFTVLLCPLSSLFLCGSFDGAAKYVGLLCFLLNLILIIS